MEKVTDFFENVLGKFSEKMTQNKIIKSISDAAILVTPVSLGVALIAVIFNLQIPGWYEFIQQTGLNKVANDFISLTMSLAAIYLATAVAYKYTQLERGKDGLLVGIISMASFLGLIPIEMSESGVSMIAISHLGSKGIFLSMIIGIIISSSYCKLMKKKIKIKLPSSVPSNVADSLSPTFVNMIILTCVFLVKYGFTLTKFGDVFTFVSTMVQAPLINVGSTAGALIFIQVVTVLLWFFGIHPSTLSAVVMPIVMSTTASNIEAYSSGKPLPFLAAGVIYYVLVSDGVGNTLGLCICSFLAKSEKYKAMRKIIIPSNIFNINEPIIFGFPIMLNPIYFIPMILVTLMNGIVAIVYMKIITIPLNPSIYMAWATPRPIFTFLAGGWQFLLLWLVCLAVGTLIWLPFFKIDDKKELELEKEKIKVEVLN